MFSLHTWGPGFGLPSIDAQCLAAIFYLQRSLSPKEWAVVPSSDLRVSPLGELPALHDSDGDVWVGGFTNIVEYIQTVMRINEDLDGAQKAECEAFSTFVVSRGQPLLDLCYFVSSDNYNTCTRRVLAEILTWPASWTVPHRLRAQAKKRSEHLGLSSLDVDTAQEEEEKNREAHSSMMANAVPKSLRAMSKESVMGIMRKNLNKTRFRLDAVTEDFFEALSATCGKTKWLLRDKFCSADCLVLAYLVLMQTPELPHHWLCEALREKHQNLDTWARERYTEMVSPAVDKARPEGNRWSIPWREPSARSYREVFDTVLEETVGALPVIGPRVTMMEISSSSGTSVERFRKKQSYRSQMKRRRALYLETLASSLSMAGLVGWMVYEGVLPLARWTRSPGRPKFGEAGSFLGLG